jgi:competence protein ComEA
VTQEPQLTNNGLERWAPLALVLLFLLALGGGVALLLERNGPSGIEIVLPTPTAQVAPTPTVELTPTIPPTFQVYLSGSVAKPGLYTFTDGNRLTDVLPEAGGVTGDADLARLNLALRLRDEGHIHALAVGEIPAEPTSTLLNLNTATQEQLEGLPGIGAVRAADIITYRDSNGGFNSLTELREITGIRSATITGIIDLFTIE